LFFLTKFFLINHVLQFIAVFKALSDNSKTHTGDALSVDTSAVLLNLTVLVTRIADDHGHTLKMSLCSLIDCICNNSGVLILRRDVVARYDILDKIIEWIQDPAQVSSNQFDRYPDLLNPFRFQGTRLDCSMI
jgi:hypothetical protein